MCFYYQSTKRLVNNPLNTSIIKIHDLKSYEFGNVPFFFTDAQMRDAKITLSEPTNVTIPETDYFFENNLFACVGGHSVTRRS
jgi:hypothetical protein